jgi:ABC-type nitrate/sulfonate/bicarbonate transport system permease component
MRRIAGLLPPFRGLLPLVIGLVGWQLIQSGPSPNFPPPSRWWTVVVQLAHNGTLGTAVVDTLTTFFVGLALACFVGFFLGLAIGTIAVVRRWSGMLLEYLRALPPTVMIPIFVLILGYSTQMKVLVVALTSSWPILLNTIAGVDSIRGLLLDVARALRMPWHVTMWKIVIPAVIPAFLVGVRVAVALSIVLTLLVEMFTGLPGIGQLMIAGQRNFNSAQVFGLLAVVGVIAYAISLAFTILEGIVLRRWPPRPGFGDEMRR